MVDDSAHESAVRLYKFAIKDKKVSRVTDNTDWIENFDVSRDGKWAAAVASRELSYAWDQKIAPATYLVDLSTGKRTEIYPDGKIRPYDVRWARDNSGFYVLAPYLERSALFHRDDYEALFLRRGGVDEHRSESRLGALARRGFRSYQRWIHRADVRRRLHEAGALHAARCDVVARMDHRGSAAELVRIRDWR